MIIAKTYIYRYFSLFIAGLIVCLWITPVLAQTAINSTTIYHDLLWLLIATSLVFFMNAGFAMLEAGLCQTRNAVNVLAKNLIVFCISILAFWSLGFGFMFGDGNSWLGLNGFFFAAFTPPFNNSFPADFSSLAELYPQKSFIAVFFWQLVFAGTAATIVSGAVAERVKFWAFFWFSFCLVAVAYPIAGHWVWGSNGWLHTEYRFLDFAGSTVVHSVGGMAGLVGAMLLEPRRGWHGFNPDLVAGERFSDRSKTFGYYNMTFSILGCLILWLGWLGFNGGSAQTMVHVPHIMVTTMFAAATGGIFVLLLRGFRPHKLSLVSVINGILGGLVGITASSAYVSLTAAMFIGAVSSLCVLVVEDVLKSCRIDDPIGAIPVHLGCGIWGTIAAGIFANPISPYIDGDIIRTEQLFNQVVGIIAVNGFIFVLSLIFWLLIGFLLYCTELINELIQSPSDRDRNLRYRSESIIPGSLWSTISKYLKISREAIRVTATEESQGSDGTFDKL